MPSYWGSDGQLVDGRFELTRGSKTIQTHNAVSVSANGVSVDSIWRDSSGFSDLSATYTTDSGTVTSSLTVYWSNDGITQHGNEAVIAAGTRTNGAGSTKTKARYFKLVIGNGDAGVAHTGSAWAYLLT